MKFLSLIFIFWAAKAFADDPLQKAEAMLRSGKQTEEAKQIIAHYLTAQETATAYVKVGTLYARLKDWTNSVHYLEIASHRDERNPLILYELGVAQHQNKLVNESVATLRKAIVLSPKSEKIYYALGEILELARDKYDARNIYLSALEKVKNKAHAYARLCWLNFQDSFFRETIRLCTKAGQLDSQDAVSVALLARTYYLNQQRPEAFRILQLALLHFPKEPLLYRVRGLIYYEEKAYEQAINDLGKAFGLDPEDDEAAIYLARSYFQLSYFDRALPIYVEACRIDRDFRFEFLAKQRELSRKDHEDMASKYQQELDHF